MYIYAPHVSMVPTESRSVLDSPRTGVKDSCELLCGFWELNPGPLEGKSVLLTAEPIEVFFIEGRRGCKEL